MEGWKDWEGKKVFIILKNNREYTGVVLEVETHSNAWIWITLKDKFGQKIGFSAEQIKLIQEESGK